jgi:hypothetical protein
MTKNIEVGAECEIDGTLVRDDKAVEVQMTWNLDHNMDRAFQREFLKLRCRALQEAFGDLKGAQGTVKAIAFDRATQMPALDKGGRPIVVEGKIVHRACDCTVRMGFRWPWVGDEKWKELKTKFKDVFEIATLRGGVECEETENEIEIHGQFVLCDKGGN